MGVRLEGVEPSKRGLVVQLLIKLLLPYLMLIKCRSEQEKRTDELLKEDEWEKG